MGCTRHILLAFMLTSVSVPSVAATPGGNEDATVMVHSSRNSGLIRINIQQPRKIGTVTLDVMDAQGRTWYREEGKAMTGELVRNLDKGILPKGELTLRVKSKDLDITQRFVVE
ncbi:MAG: T9SS type A sorting domain-containing protein [Flavobacteriales bacterium]|nr:T9SS type A sorting domain-containing protein [Flavobacteriales bacterium]